MFVDQKSLHALEVVCKNIHSSLNQVYLMDQSETYAFQSRGGHLLYFYSSLSIKSNQIKSDFILSRQCTFERKEN